MKCRRERIGCLNIAMIDRALNTKEKRFMVALILFGLLLFVFLLNVYRFFTVVHGINMAHDLLVLTQSNYIQLYFPIQIITNLLDVRLNFTNVIIIIFKHLPLGFYLILILSFYLASNLFKRDHPYYRYQQWFIVFFILFVLFQLTLILTFLYGFLGGSVTSAIQRIHFSSVLGRYLSVGFIIGYLVLLVHVLFNYPNQS